MRIIIGAVLTAMLFLVIMVMAVSEHASPPLIIILVLGATGLVLLMLTSFKSLRQERIHGNEFMLHTLRELISELKSKQIILNIFNENILQSVPSGVMSIDNNGVITKINEAGKEILNKGDITGKHISEVIGRPLLEYILNNEYIKREEVLCEISSKKVWLGFSISPLRDRDKKIIGKIIIFTDITEFKELQLRSKLREQLQGLGEMAAGIAHELRNPMAVLSGYASMLKKKSSSTEETKALIPIIDAISREVALMDNIIKDFLQFARYDEPELASVNIKKVTEEVISSLLENDPSISSKITIQSNMEDSIIEADETLLRQTLKNLIQNAIEAMPDGGILKIDGSLKGKDYILSIRDSGKGIPEDIREKVFIPFFTTKPHGSGLGLSIVHKAITAHGGEVTFESSPQGTTFTLRIPSRASGVPLA